MLPFTETSVHGTNPRFDALYNDLCKRKLNVDGTSVLDADEQKQRLAFETELHQAQLQAARRHVLIATMRELAYKSGALPAEFHELVAIVAAQLEGQITADDAEIAYEALSSFKDHLPKIAREISRQVQQHSALLSSLAKTQKRNTTPEDVIRQWQTTISELRISALSINRQQTTVAEQMHSTYRQLIELCIRALEQTIHGAVSRGTKAKTDYLVMVLEGMAKKLEVQYSQLISQLDTDDIRQALRSRNQDLSRQVRQLKVQLRDREDSMDDIRRSLEGNETATNYLSIIREIATIEQQLELAQRV